MLAAFVVIAHTRGTPATSLDAQGRAMLAPIRTEALRPDELLARLHLRGTETVADVGAGPGFFALRLARQVPRGRVIATDLRADYLAELRTHARAQDLGNIETRLVIDPDDPTLAPRSVDIVVLAQVEHYLPDRRRYFARLATALRPGGRIVLVNYARYREPDLAAAAATSLHVVDGWSPSPPFFVLVLTPQEVLDADH